MLSWISKGYPQLLKRCVSCDINYETVSADVRQCDYNTAFSSVQHESLSSMAARFSNKRRGNIWGRINYCERSFAAWKQSQDVGHVVCLEIGHLSTVQKTLISPSVKHSKAPTNKKAYRETTGPEEGSQIQ